MTPRDTLPPLAGPTDTPFGAGRATHRTRLLIAGGLLGAAVLTFLLVRRAPAPEPMPAGHQHGAASAAPGEGPVTLDDGAAHRIGITYAAVTYGPFGRDVRAVAQVSFAEPRVRSVTFLTEGWVERLMVDFTGQAVRAGDPLLTVYSPMIVTAEEELLLARRLALQVAGGDAAAVRNADELVGAARRRLRAWGVPQGELDRLESTGEVHRSVTFRSPWSGVVIEKGVVAGQRLMPGDVAYRIADLDVVWLEGEIFEQDLAGVRPGLAVTAEFTALPGDLRRGRVTYVYPTIDPETRTARIRVELANPGLVLKPGMYGTIRLTAPGRAALSVPRSAVLSTGERSLVFLKRTDGRLEPRPVTVGRAAEDRVEILAGLDRTDTVVASGTFLLDAESNLGSLLGGMGGMPGMDMAAPETSDTPAQAPRAMPEMPGMDHSQMSPVP